jgi:hypothetical protein
MFPYLLLPSAGGAEAPVQRRSRQHGDEVGPGVRLQEESGPRVGSVGGRGPGASASSSPTGAVGREGGEAPLAGRMGVGSCLGRGGGRR